MNKTVIMIMGPSGCGKSTLEQQIVSYGDMVKKVVSVTTRPPRAGEQDGIDYHFITEQQFQHMVLQNELIQTTNFGGYNYGSARKEYTTNHTISTLVVVPSSGQYLTDCLAKDYPHIDVMHVYFNITPERLIYNMRERGDTEEMISQRLASDDLEFQMKQTSIEPDFIVTDDMLDQTLSIKLLNQLLYKDL